MTAVQACGADLRLKLYIQPKASRDTWAGALVLTLATAVGQRASQLALLRVLGARPFMLFSLVTIEALLLGLLAGVAGLGAAVFFMAQPQDLSDIKGLTGTSKSRDLRAVLQSDDALAVLAQTPLFLSIMCLAYRDLPAPALAQTAQTEGFGLVARAFGQAIAAGRANDDLPPQLNALAAGGAEIQGFGSTFFSRGFGMVKDRYGTHWMISVAPEEPLDATADA